MNIGESLILKIKYEDHLKYLIDKYQINLDFQIFKFSNIYKKNFIFNFNNIFEQVSIFQSNFEYINYINEFYKINICSNIYSKSILDNLFMHFANLYYKYIAYNWNYIKYTSDNDSQYKLITEIKNNMVDSKKSIIKAVNNSYFLNFGYSKIYNGNFIIPFNSSINVNPDFIEQYIYTLFICNNNYENMLINYNFENKNINLLINKIIEHIYETGHESPIFENNEKVFNNIRGVIL